MALKKQVTMKSNFGDDVSFPEAYVKVENVAGNKQELRVEVFVYKKQGEQVIDRKGYSFNPNLNGINFIAQAYEYLKTLPEFADAVDC